MLPVYSGYFGDFIYVNPPEGKCIIVECDGQFMVKTTNDRFYVFKKKDKYRVSDQYYGSVEEFIQHKNLECIPVEALSVKVEQTYGDMDTVCLVSVVAPDGTWLLVRVYEGADYGESEDEINLYRVGGDWVPTNSFVKFNNKEMLDNQIKLLDDLGMLDH